MIEGYSMGFWYVFVVVMALLSLVGVFALITMVVSGIAELKEWARKRKNA